MSSPGLKRPAAHGWVPGSCPDKVFKQHTERSLFVVFVDELLVNRPSPAPVVARSEVSEEALHVVVVARLGEIALLPSVSFEVTNVVNVFVKLLHRARRNTVDRVAVSGVRRLVDVV